MSKVDLFRMNSWLILASTMMLAGCSSLLITSLNRQDLTNVAIEDEKMYVLGLFNIQSKDEIVRAIEENPQVKTLVLTANSGSIDDDATFSLARYIRERGLDTYLLKDTVIASGAVDLFLAGNQRFIEKGARIGVYPWSDGRKQATEYHRDDSAHELNASYIRDMLGDDEFYWFTIEAAPADGMYWMTQEEIAVFNLPTSSILAAGSDPTPFGKEFLEIRAVLVTP